jgi:transcriptional regulator with XRE-family HTH domain
MLTGDAIRTFREVKGWSQHDLAQRLGVGQATVSRIENGAEPSGPVRVILEMMISPAKEAAQ